MVRQTKAQREWKPGQVKKARSVFMLFASSVLTLEALVVFFATLVIFGLRRNELPWIGIFVLGILFSVILVVTCAFLSKKWAVLVGWIEQLALVALGLIEPMMYLVGAMFLFAWWYAVVTGKRIDREVRAREAHQSEPTTTS